jgi:hypothetical protein
MDVYANAWNGIGNSTFLSTATKVAWNGSMWIAVGGLSTTTVAYTYDVNGATSWTPLSTGSTFDNVSTGIAWNGSMWIAVGNINNEIISSTNGTVWSVIPSLSFITLTNISWNGLLWVGGGVPKTAANISLAYSYDGINWNAASSSTNFFSSCACLAWNGSMWLAGGNGSSTIATSRDGINWTGLGNTVFSTYTYGIAYNSARPNTITFGLTGGSSGVTGTISGNITSAPISLSAGNVLDVVSDTYYNTGFSNFAVSITTD